MGNLFTNIICHVCGQDIFPATQANNSENGFLDQDTGQHAHMKCKSQHYKLKQQQGMGGLYSEMPIIF